MKNLISSLLICLCVLLTSCGGGGGGGGTDSAVGGPNPNIVTIGTVQFNITTSTNFSAHDFYFNMAVNQAWGIATPIGSALAPESFPYSVGTLALAGQASLPYTIVQNASATPVQSLGVAVSIDGALYVVVATTDTGAAGVALAEPILMIPNNSDLYVGFTVASGFAPTGGMMQEAIHPAIGAPPFQLTVVSINETSPSGFLNCLHIHLFNGSTDPNVFDTFDVWYQAGEGAVDEVMSSGTGGPPAQITDEEVRTGIAFPG